MYSAVPVTVFTDRSLFLQIVLFDFGCSLHIRGIFGAQIQMTTCLVFLGVVYRFAVTVAGR